MSEFLKRIGADTKAKYVSFKCADGYSETLDMPTALHPQTILATKYAREPIADPFGFPLRLRTATNLGFKCAKWITAMEVTNTFIPTFWSKQGFNWFAGIYSVAKWEPVRRSETRQIKNLEAFTGSVKR
jgi:DMSO/TMAO reductase YedYZ molybdopterin-dependent catalytic subunit